MPGPWRTKAKRFHIKNTMTKFCERKCCVLLVSPEGVIPICSGQNNDICHARSTTFTEQIHFTEGR